MGAIVPTDAAAAGARRTPRVRDIDFARPTKFTKDQQRRVERAHEAFCRAATTQLSTELRYAVELELAGVSQLTWAAAIAELPSQSIFAALETEPLGTRILLNAELPGIARLIECLLGGSGDSAAPARELTEIELALARRVFGTMLAQLTPTWEELAGLRLGLRDVVSQPASIHLAPSTEPTLMVEIRLGADGDSALLALVIPYRSIEPVADRLQNGQFGHQTPTAAAAEAERLRHAVAAVEIELRAEVAAVELSVEDVLSLQPGDVLRLGAPADAGVLLCADGVPIHRCKPGRTGNRRAVEVLQRVVGER